MSISGDFCAKKSVVSKGTPAKQCHMARVDKEEKKTVKIAIHFVRLIDEVMNG